MISTTRYLYCQDPSRFEWALNQLPKEARQEALPVFGKALLDQPDREITDLVQDPSVAKMLGNMKERQNTGFKSALILCRLASGSYRFPDLEEQLLELNPDLHVSLSEFDKTRPIPEEHLLMLIAQILETDIYDLQFLQEITQLYPTIIEKATKARRSISPFKPKMFMGCDQTWEKVVKTVPFLQHALNPNVHSRETTVWERDARVVRRDGSHLIPYPLSEVFEDRATLGRRSFRLLKSLHPLEMKYRQFGNGLDIEYVEKARMLATSLGIPFVNGKTCIEGGNCILTEKEVIVGTTSVVLSFISLWKMGLLSSLDEKIGHIEEPEERFIKMARNYEQLTIEPRFDISEPITDKEREAHKNLAKQFQVKWETTLEFIAEELQIPVENLIVLDHYRLHIDLEALAAPNRRIFLHEPFQARAELAKIGAKEELQTKNMNPSAQIICERNAKILERHGFEVIRVPGYFELENDEAMMLLNGVLVQTDEKILLLTNGIEQGFGKEKNKEYLPIIERTFERFRAHGIHPIFIENKLHLGGGIHCLTFLQQEQLAEELPLLRIDSPSPTHIPTKVRAKLDRTISPQATIKIGEQIGRRDSPHEMSWTLPVPLDGPTSFTVSVDEERKGNIKMVPGQSQILHI